MNKLTRRLFGKRLLAVGAVSIFDRPSLLPQTSTAEPPVTVPDRIAGYTLTADEKRLAEKFLSTHTKNMTPLRINDLPNSLPPDFAFASPGANASPGKGKEKKP